MNGLWKKAPSATSVHRIITRGLLLSFLVAGCEDPETSSDAVSETNYSDDKTATTCAPGSKTGAAGATDAERTAQGYGYNVRTPSNYSPLIAHPLLVVYAPAARSAAGNERFINLTREGTKAGFIVAYAENRRMSIPTIIEQGTIPSLVAKKWCVDESKVYFTGHSNGGTIPTALSVLKETQGIATAIAPSGAGFTGENLSEYTCPAPISVMVMHSAEDALFPGYGAETSKWWANCNKCEATPSKPLANGCVAYENCADNTTTLYCEGTGGHGKWPPLNADIIDFFLSATKAPSPSP
jgi:polyhydroxybutyrate depolymerase